jgi:hypothetical protein
MPVLVEEKFKTKLITVVNGKPIELIGRKIDSGNIEQILWPKTGEPLMIVQFKSGTRYAYLGVSRQRAVACAYARSSGEFLNKRIKPNFDVVKLR